MRQDGNFGGISLSGEYVKSDYFSRLKKLGDFEAATRTPSAYHHPYLDFGISKIHEKFYYVIGKMWKLFSYLL